MAVIADATVSENVQEGLASYWGQGDLRRASSSFDGGDIAFIAVAGILVFFMVPGLAFLYSGLARRKSALTLVWAVAASNAVVIFQWWFWGYSLAFSPTATNGYIGNLRSFALRKVMSDPSPGSPLIPELLYSFYQMEFACVTVGILMGALVDRGRVLPAMVFTFVWMTVVYCPLACWAWNPNGWGYTWGVLDYAGGGPVEIGSGVSGLAYAWVLGRRSERELLNFRPHNVSFVYLGTAMLWFGWLGFNGGSAFGANLRAVLAIWNSMLAAAMAGIVWCALDFHLERKYTMVGFCSGTIAGLVAATPASGYIPQWAAFVMGIVVGVAANYATKIKFLLRVDDALDLYAEHAIGGVVGLIFNALFADSELIALDGVNTSVPGGWIDRNWKQLYIQVAYVFATCGYSFVVTAIIAKTIDLIPGLALRTTPEMEAIGMDDAQIGEFATDYIEVRRHYSDWTPSVDRKGSDTKASETDSRMPLAAGDRHARPDLSIERPKDGRSPSGERSTGGSLDGLRWGRRSADEGREHFTAGDRHAGTELGPRNGSRSRSRGRVAQPQLASINEKENGDVDAEKRE
ncbi:ammonium transporter [Daedalea quercina L-15889]|uniref:Ammonium transporter n=1 Tax=Daedalea quercina L-15889 TaxID=1314783 RepID=A0A165P0B2_9APHY|nr:ammonium transporter [Daedalea quercina L-15889]